MSNLYKYKESEKVKNAFDEYSEHKENKKPKDYSFSDSALLEKAKNDYFNVGSFSYDVESDPLYQQYKKSYLSEGKRAMEDTVGNASSLTGGYANSYALTAGQSAYNEYAKKLNDVIPELYSLAYSKHKDNVELLGDRLEYLSGRDSEEYSRYKDGYDAYSDELSALQKLYLDSSELDRSTQKSEWEAAYKNALLANDRAEFDAELALKMQELAQNDREIGQKDRELDLKEQQHQLAKDEFEESIREYFREDELYVMLSNGGYYNALLGLDANYNNDKMVKLKALSMGIPEDYIDAFLELR